jgi:hypothetical protein
MGYNTHPMATTEMEAKVERLYEYRNHLNILDRNKLFTKEKSELIKDDPRQIKTWIQMAERIVKVHKWEVKRIHREKAMMEQYFKWHPPNNNNNELNIFSPISSYDANDRPGLRTPVRTVACVVVEGRSV